MIPYSVYLAGPIRGLNYTGAVDWRKYVAKRLAPEIISFSPMRYKEYLASLVVLGETDEDNPLTSQKGIVSRDYFDVMRTSLMLVNLLGSTQVSIGTCVEFGFAHSKPIGQVVTVMEKGNIHDHAFIREISNYIVSDLDQAIEMTRAILLP